MSAGVPIKSYRPFRQDVVDNKFEYQLTDKSGSYTLDYRGMNIGKFSPDFALLCNFIEPYEYHPGPAEAGDIKMAFDSVMDHVSQSFSHEQTFEQIYATLFVLGTYSFRRFELFPNLWLHTPHSNNLLPITMLFRNLCFNGIQVNDSFSSEAIMSCVDILSPTLIFGHLHNGKSLGYDFLLEPINSKALFVPSKELKIAPLYCPKVIVSNIPPLPKCQLSFLSLVSNQSPSSYRNRIDFPSLRGWLCRASLALQEALSKQDAEIDTLSISSPIRILARALAELNAMDSGICDSFLKELSIREYGISSHERFSHAYGILYGLHEFLKNNGLDSGDRYYSLQDIVTYLKESELIGDDFDARLLSRFINANGLLRADPKRQRCGRTTNTTPTSMNPNPSQYQQLTFVQIDKMKLQHLLTNAPKHQRIRGLLT